MPISPTYYPIGTPVAIVVGTVGGYRQKVLQAKADSNALRAGKLARIRSDQNESVAPKFVKRIFGSLREVLGASPAPTMREALGIA